MSDFNLIPCPRDLFVEGIAESKAVGPFKGEVIAIGLRGTDPIAEAQTDQAPSTSNPEGLLGWGTTHLLVVSEDHPNPIWVSKNDVERTSLAEVERSI